MRLLRQSLPAARDKPLAPRRISLPAQELARKHAASPDGLGLMHQQLRKELDEVVSAAEALPRAREKERSLRALAERLARRLSAARRR